MLVHRVQYRNSQSPTVENDERQIDTYILIAGMDSRCQIFA